MKREQAWRIFSSEYNDSKIEIKGEGEMAPSYIITPLGAKINRVFIVGVLTDVENVMESGDFVRAHVSDPTGVFTLYSGHYQQDITNELTNIDVPTFVAVIGKIRTYTPDDSEDMYSSIRPEKIIEVNSDIRDKWIVETCESTKYRIEAYLEAKKMSEPKINDLKKLGFNTILSEGLITALQSYENIDYLKYLQIIKESLEFIDPDKKNLTKDIKKSDKWDNDFNLEGDKLKSFEEETENSKEIENKILDIIKKIEDEEGAPWDLITENCEKSGIDKDSIEEAINSLMEKGLIFEPILGIIKTT
jgi:RPA family protein